MREKLVRRNFKAFDRKWPAFDGKLEFRSPGGHAKNWSLNNRFEIPNRRAIAIARFIARWNGYELVKKKEEK